MALNLVYPHIEKRPGEPARLQRVPRIRVAQLVMDYLAYGWSADEMCRQFALDADDNVVLAGRTTTVDFATPGASQALGSGRQAISRQTGWSTRPT